MKLFESTLKGFPIFEVDSWHKLSHGFVGREVDLKFSPSDWQKVSDKKLLLLDQVHGVDIVDFDSLKDYSKPIKADAWIGSIENLKSNDVALGIKTADCTPVLILAKNNFAALHCGWRSAYSGLLELSLKQLILRSEELKDIRIAFGPAAQICCYEVDIELQRKFEEKNSIFQFNPKEVSVVSNGKLYISVSSYLYNQALSFGIPDENIVISKNCTICEKRFFSFRREKDDSGRQVSYFSP